jgi:thiol-disulfide isomerase/thioredoxin
MNIRTVALCIAVSAATLLGSSHSNAQDARSAESKPATENPAAKKKVRENIYDEKADAKQALADAVAKARKDNQRVLVQWGANWCGWCHLLHELYKKDEKIAHELLFEYKLVMVDVGRFDKNLDLAEKLGADLKKAGLPYLTILDGDGKVLANQETSSLEKPDKGDRAGHDPAKVLDFLKKHAATPLDAAAVLAEGMARAAKEDKRVFLHFGAPWCGWCHRLEDWMATPAVRDLLAKDFVVTKIDNDRMKGGTDIFNKYCKTPGGIPWFVFLDKEGTVLATSDAPKGNIGFPATPEEIDWFAGMLARARQRMTDADIAAVRESLAPKK